MPKRKPAAYWNQRRAKAARIPIQATRQEELSAIAQHIAKRGLITCAPSHQQETIQSMQNNGPQPMPGWR